MLGSVSAAYDPNDFVTTWKTDTTSENPTSITLNFRPFGATGYYEVSWKCNGTYMVVYDHNYTHNYGTAGTYDVCIRSLAPLAFHHSPLTLDDRSKLLEVKQWGGIRWSSFSEAFRGAINLQITATDVPNLSQVTNMSSAFNGAVRLVGNDSMSNWDTSSVTDMNFMFNSAISFNTNIGNWNTSRVTDMNTMFNSARKFNNGDVPGGSNNSLNWDTSKVTNMYRMFRDAGSFNSPIGSWNTSNVKYFSTMFAVTNSFNQDIGNWDTSNADSIASMFVLAKSFNQDISRWNTSGITNMNSVFDRATSFNQDISSWNISKVTRFNSFLNAAGMKPDLYDRLLDSWSKQSVKPNILFHAEGLYYCKSYDARNILINPPNNWSISDAGQRCPPQNLNLSNKRVNESTTEVGIVSADGEGTIIFSLVSGTGDEDNSKFALNPSSGLLVFLEAPDFENPTDLGDPSTNNTYSIRVQANNEAGNSEEVFIITVIDVDDVGPVINITMKTIKAEGNINDTTFNVSDRFSIMSVEVDKSSVAAAEDISCEPIAGSPTQNKSFPFINEDPRPENHLVLSCNITVKSSGKLVIRATDNAGYSTTASTEEGYAIDTLGPTFLIANIDTSAPYSLHQPLVKFHAVSPVGVEKYEIQYKNSSGVETNETVNYIGDPQNLTVDLFTGEMSHAIEIIAYSNAGKKTSRRITFPPEITFIAPTIISNNTINDTIVKIISPEGHQIDNITIGGSAYLPGLTNISCIDKDGRTIGPYNTSITCNITGIQETGMIEVSANDTTIGERGKNLQKYFYDTSAPNITISAPTKVKNDDITNVAITITDDLEMYNDSASIDPSSTVTYTGWSCEPCNIDRRKLNCIVNITGSGNLTILATDKAGNAATNSENDFIIDRESPEVNITTIAPITSLNQLLYTIKGTCTEGDGDITITVSGQNYLTECLGDGSWNTTINMLALPEGNVSINATQTDYVGNRGETTREILKDTIPPFVEYEHLTTNILSPELSGDIDDSDATIIVKIEQTGQTVTATNNQDGSWTVSAGDIYGLTSNLYNLKLTATDIVGNSYETLGQLSIDATNPGVAFNDAITPRDGYRTSDKFSISVKIDEPNMANVSVHFGDSVHIFDFVNHRTNFINLTENLTEWIFNAEFGPLKAGDKVEYYVSVFDKFGQGNSTERRKIMGPIRKSSGLRYLNQNVTESINSSEGFQIIKGQDKFITLEFSNGDSMNSIGAIQFSIEGNISDYIRISQSNFSDLPPNSSVNITIEILSPELIGVGKQEIRVILTGEKNNAPYIETRTLAIEVSDLPTKPGKTRFKNIIFWILGIIVSIFVLYKLISFILVRSNYLNRS